MELHDERPSLNGFYFNAPRQSFTVIVTIQSPLLFRFTTTFKKHWQMVIIPTNFFLILQIQRQRASVSPSSSSALSTSPLASPNAGDQSTLPTMTTSSSWAFLQSSTIHQRYIDIGFWKCFWTCYEATDFNEGWSNSNY